MNRWDTRSVSEWVEKLNSCSDSRERRAIVTGMEPLLEGLAQTESDILFPVLERYLCFAEWMQEAHAHHSGIRELIQFARVTSDHEKFLDITDELASRLALYLDGRQKILFPRLIQALSRKELADLKRNLGRYWMFNDSLETGQAAA